MENLEEIMALNQAEKGYKLTKETFVWNVLWNSDFYTFIQKSLTMLMFRLNNQQMIKLKKKVGIIVLINMYRYIFF